MNQHAQVTLAADMAFSVRDPHSPWQWGSKENTDGLPPQCFPKGTDLSAHSVEHLQAVAAEGKDRLRKTLGMGHLGGGDEPSAARPQPAGRCDDPLSPPWP